MTLQERLRTLTAPCRKVDEEIARAFGYRKAAFECDGIYSTKTGFAWVPSNCSDAEFCVAIETARENYEENRPGRAELPHFTSSLDAAVELVERELPDAEIDFSIFLKHAHACVYVGGGQGYEKQFTHVIPAVALLRALIAAKGVY